MILSCSYGTHQKLNVPVDILQLRRYDSFKDTTEGLTKDELMADIVAELQHRVKKASEELNLLVPNK
jgi:hypothetical protein